MEKNKNTGLLRSIVIHNRHIGETIGAGTKILTQTGVMVIQNAIVNTGVILLSKSLGNGLNIIKMMTLLVDD